MVYIINKILVSLKIIWINQKIVLFKAFSKDFYFKDESFRARKSW